MKIRFVKDWNPDREKIKYPKGTEVDLPERNCNWYIGEGLAEAVVEPVPVIETATADPEPEVAVKRPYKRRKYASRKTETQSNDPDGD